MRSAAIIGTGLIGGSLGAALRRSGWVVRGFDADPITISRSVDFGLIDEASPSIDRAVTGAEVVLLAVPVRQTVTLLPKVDISAFSDALILDTASVKRPVVAAMQELGHGDRAIGGHPLAGSHRSGPAAANVDLFHGRPFVLCPSSCTSPSTVSRAEAVVEELGALPLVLDADRHDRALAVTSHLPQILSTLLALQGGDGKLAGPAYRDMTRLAGSSTSMWSDILTANRDYVLAALSSYSGSLRRFSEALERDDAEEIEQVLAGARAAVTA